ncbi:hypothetical protein Tco_1510792, partial [Tanacetum coccineum]
NSSSYRGLDHPLDLVCRMVDDKVAE